MRILISLRLLNDILLGRLESICNAPEPMSLIWSYVKYNFRGRHNPEAEYIEKYGFDYDFIVSEDQPIQEVLPDSPRPEVEKKTGWKYVLYSVMGVVGGVVGLLAFRKRGDTRKH